MRCRLLRRLRVAEGLPLLCQLQDGPDQSPDVEDDRLRSSQRRTRTVVYAVPGQLRCELQGGVADLVEDFGVWHQPRRVPDLPLPGGESQHTRGRGLVRERELRPGPPLLWNDPFLSFALPLRLPNPPHLP